MMLCAAVNYFLKLFSKTFWSGVGDLNPCMATWKDAALPDLANPAYVKQEEVY